MFSWFKKKKKKVLKVITLSQNQCHVDKVKSSLILAQSLQRLPVLILISSKQATCDAHVIQSGWLFLCWMYFLFACFQEELEEIWKELLQGNFLTVLMSKTSALLSKYILRYSCAEIVCFVAIVLFIYLFHDDSCYCSCFQLTWIELVSTLQYLMKINMTSQTLGPVVWGRWISEIGW